MTTWKIKYQDHQYKSLHCVKTHQRAYAHLQSDKSRRLYTWITRRTHKNPEVPKPLGLARLHEGRARASVYMEANPTNFRLQNASAGEIST